MNQHVITDKEIAKRLEVSVLHVRRDLRKQGLRMFPVKVKSRTQYRCTEQEYQRFISARIAASEQKPKKRRGHRIRPSTEKMSMREYAKTL